MLPFQMAAPTAATGHGGNTRGKCPMLPTSGRCDMLASCTTGLGAGGGGQEQRGTKSMDGSMDGEHSMRAQVGSILGVPQKKPKQTGYR